MLISYGDLSSADLLTAYGFVEEAGSNPHDCLPLDLVRAQPTVVTMHMMAVSVKQL